jgi:hypothetical protein
MKDLNPQIVCADGFKMSVQGNQNAYCQPRNDQGPYYQVECGFPSEVPLLYSQSSKHTAESYSAKCPSGIRGVQVYTPGPPGI